MGNVNNGGQLEQNIAALSDGAKVAIVLCANSFRFGGNWAFIKKEKRDFRSQLETLKSERPNVKAIPVANGALVLVSEAYLADNVNKAIPNAINGSFVAMAGKRRTDEKARFQKFLKSVAEGKSQHIRKAKGYTEITIGVFSVNETNLIRINGKDYPAYKLSLIEALEYANQLTALGKKVYARAIREDGVEVYDQIHSLASNSKGQSALYRGLEIADSDTGTFLTLRITQ